MKEGKKNIAKRKVASSASSKRVVPKNQTPKMPAKHEEPPKVKKIDVEEINKDFDDVENEDRRLIVFIAIAILVIVGTIIGLLVGCEKKNNNTPEPDKPGTDVIVPEKPDEKGNEDEGVVTREIIRKVRAVYTNKKNKKNNGKKDNKVEETVTYNVTYYLGEETNVEEVEKGKTPPKYVPTGYSVCRYYKDSELTEDFDMTQAIKSNVNIYMDCDAITYNIVYDSESNNPTEYDVTQGDVPLEDPLGVNGYFNGWYSDPEFTNKVTSLNKSLVELADENNTIRLYAYITDEPIEEPEPTDDPTTGDDNQDDMTIDDENRLDGPEVLDDEIEEIDVIDDEEENEEEIIVDTEVETEEDDEEDLVEPTKPEITPEEDEDETIVNNDTEEEDTPPVVITEPEEDEDETETIVEETTEPAEVEEPKAEEPMVEEPKEEKPVVEEVKPAVEELEEEVPETKVVTPKEEPKEEVKEEPKVEEPKAEEPKVEEKKEEAKPQKETPKPETKPEVKVEKKEPEVKEEVKEEVEETTETEE